MSNGRKKNDLAKKGFTLVEALVAIFLLALVFLGLTASYRLALKVIGLSKDKFTATGIANEQMEKIKNLPYASVGTQGAVLPAAAGTLDKVASKTINREAYTITTDVKYAVDPADGVGVSDTCNLDYKIATVNISWQGSFPGSVGFSTILAPKDATQEIQSCTNQPGGILTVRAFDGTKKMISEPLLAILDSTTGSVVASATPSSGLFSFPLPVGTYRVRASKSGYSMARSYSFSEMTMPDVPDPLVSDGGMAETSLSIDKLATLAIDGVSSAGEDFFSDTFLTGEKIIELSDTEISSGNVVLSGNPYPESGTVVSKDIDPGNLMQWNEFTFSNEKPASTQIVYQILFFNGDSWIPISDAHLAGNSSGFFSSPINLSVLNAATYRNIRIKATLTTNDHSKTPRINNWQISWASNEGAPVANFPFHLKGAKTVGKNSGIDVYKYDKDLTFNASGHLDITDIEPDSYTFSVGAASSLVLAGTDPALQPIDVAPESVVPVKLYLQAQNTLTVTVQNQESLEFLPVATVHLFNAGIGYDKTQYSDVGGQAQFIPLNNGNYSITVQIPGFEGYSGNVNVSGNSAKNIQLNQID